jgi:import inner membrane translocase subunit TIM50
MLINHKLGKEATRLENGRYIKDINYLNRDLSKVIVIDFDPNNVKYHPTNTIILPEFTGDGKDRELLVAIQFLKGR